tara:strand:- start:312 stop:668 length:357 start_codon:yes stop_codon:yes gene_type:complete
LPPAAKHRRVAVARDADAPEFAALLHAHLKEDVKDDCHHDDALEGDKVRVAPDRWISLNPDEPYYSCSGEREHEDVPDEVNQAVLERVRARSPREPAHRVTTASAAPAAVAANQRRAL